MSTTTQALIVAVRRYLGDRAPGQAGGDLRDVWAAIEDAETAAPAAPAGETVTQQMIEAGAKAARDYMARTGGNSPEAIYRAMRALAPAAPVAQPVREPLTEEKLWTLFNRSGLGSYHQKHDAMECTYERCIYAFARAIERAHGIGQEGGAA